MRPFFERFPKQAAEETRTITIAPGHPSVPAGTYGFLEFFCAEDDCDCRRVVVSVMSDDGHTVMATLNYGWETVAFYRNWSHEDEFAAQLAGVSMEPLGGQSLYSEFFLGVFRDMVVGDKAYRKRIRRHYDMFKRWRPT
jgi:hypothetical protein